MDVQLHDASDQERLAALVRSERNATQRDRYRAVHLALQGMTAPEIVRRLDRSRRFVQQWVYRYRDGGLDNLGERPRPGQPPKLRRADETSFLARLDAGPQPSDGVCTLRGRDVQRILTREFCATYSLAGAYSLLHRLGYSCLKPRPRHRKNDPAAMAAWKQNAPLLFRKSDLNTPNKKSKSGFRMKAASANKAR